MHLCPTTIRRFLRRTLVGLGVLALLSGLLGPAGPAKAYANNYQFPCDNYGINGYGYGQYVSGWGYHVGEDACGGAGRAIFAAGEGTVMYAARTPDSYRWGNLVMVEHTNPDGGKAVTLYGHLGDNRQVSAGQTVSRGQLLGFTGPSFSAANGNWGAHLHFGVHPGGYGTSIGTYASWIHGYEGGFPHPNWMSPSTYIRDRLAPVEYGITANPGAIDLTYGGQTTVTFKLRNTTLAPWNAGGAKPVRLGTINPADRGSGFSSNGTAAGWVGHNRIRMLSTTGVGGTATFTATFKSNQTPGNYPECFGLLEEGGRWFAGPPICVTVRVATASYRAQWVNQIVTARSDPYSLTDQISPNGLLPGQQVNVKVMLKNIGEFTWPSSGPTPVRLGTSRPRDRGSGFATVADSAIPQDENWLATSRPSGIDGRWDPTTNQIVPDEEITRDEIAVFSFTATVPEGSGLLPEYFNPMVEGVGWMNDIGLWIPFQVAQGGYHFEKVTQSQTNTSVGTTSTGPSVTAQLRNTGRASWPVGGVLRLGTDRPRDGISPFYTASGTGGWLSPARASTIARNVTIPGKTVIDLGEVAEFNFKLTVPPTTPTGSYTASFRPVMEGVTWLPETAGLSFPVKVTAAPYDYQIMLQSYSNDPKSLSPGSQTLATVALKNTGRVSWKTSGPNALKLGTSRPQDRSSGFATLSGIDAWMAPSRASGIDARVTNLSRLSTVAATEIKPGEIALFKVPMTAPLTPGSYTEYFNLVAEGLTWLPDKGLNVPFRVSTGAGDGSNPSASWNATGDAFSSCTVTGTSGQACTKDIVDHSVSASWTYRVSYQTTQLPTGLYTLNLGYKNVGGVVPDTYAYKVSLRVNGGPAIPLDLAGNDTAEALTNLYLSGTSTITLEWSNDYWVPDTYDANLALTSIEVRK